MAGLFSSRTRKLPMLFQSEAAECGLACIAMIASAHGHMLDINEIRHRFRISLKGTTLKDLMSFARILGLSGRALRLEPENLGKLVCPAILHFDMNHFVVLKKMQGDKAIIHDPALGIRTIAPEQLNRRFTGVALELAPSASFETRKSGPQLRLRELIGDLDSTRGLLPRALALSIGFQLLVLAAPFYVQLVIDQGITQGDTQALVGLALGFGTIALLRGMFAWVRAQVLMAFGGFFNAQLMTNVVRHMLRLPHSWFESRHVAALLSRVTSTQPVKDLVTDGLVGAIVDGLMAVLTISVATLFAPELALVVLVGFACNLLLKWWQVSQSMKREHEYIESSAKAQEEFIETVRGIASVKLFRKEAEREMRWNDRHIESVNARYALDTIQTRATIGRDVIQTLVLIVIVYIGAGQVIEGVTSLGVLMAFITYQQMFADSAGKLLDFAGRFRLLNVHLQRLADVVLSEPEQDKHMAFGTPIQPLAGGVSATDLEFRYGDLEDPVIRSVSLDVKPGEFVAITGPSGGGKTTLMKLLVGLLEPNNGTICYDGQPISKIGLATIRDQIGVVMQDDVLLSGSLAQSITFFDALPDLEWMKECARMAAIDEDIARFPMGYNTLVGDMGTVLSGGQRQRILLARALYRKPKILFVDEGTSSLDVDKERQVNACLRSMNMTRIIIAHRRDTIEAADRILLLGPGGLG